MNRNRLASRSEIEAAEAGRGTRPLRQVEAECAALFRRTRANNDRSKATPKERGDG